jgi:hypothetical protein
MTPYEYIKNHVNVKLSPSKVHGVGVFSLRDIEPDEELFVKWKGDSGIYYISETELNTFSSDLQKHLYDMFEFEKVNDIWMMSINLNKDCHWIFETPLHWVNSCLYNETPNIDKTTLKCIKKIKLGEELFSKYGKYDKFKSINII